MKSCPSGKLRTTSKVKGDKAACKANEKVWIKVDQCAFVQIYLWFF